MFEDARPNEETNMTIMSRLLQEMCQKVGNLEREYALREIGIEKTCLNLLSCMREWMFALSK
jgi:hypothetical protein